jgi:hypothetical protein
MCIGAQNNSRLKLNLRRAVAPESAISERCDSAVATRVYPPTRILMRYLDRRYSAAPLRVGGVVGRF